MYRIEIDRSLCSAYGTCIDVAPDLFELVGRPDRGRSRRGDGRRGRGGSGQRLPDGRNQARRHPSRRDGASRVIRAAPKDGTSGSASRTDVRCSRSFRRFSASSDWVR